MSQPIEDTSASPAVRGFLHTPDQPNGDSLVLTHGAGGNAGMPLLVAVADAFCAAGITVLRCDLPFRQARPRGSPNASSAAQDRAGLKRAVLLLRDRARGKIYLGGQSYGGRQATMLAADEPNLADGLMLLSYPLHPPGKADLRTAHFPKLTTPALFVHGTRDPFGSIEEMTAALTLIPAWHEFVPVQGVGHDLGGKKSTATLPPIILRAFERIKLVP